MFISFPRSLEGTAMAVHDLARYEQTNELQREIAYGIVCLRIVQWSILSDAFALYVFRAQIILNLTLKTKYPSSVAW